MGKTEQAMAKFGMPVVVLAVLSLAVLSHARECQREDVLAEGKPAIPADCTEVHLRKAKLTLDQVLRVAESLKDHKNLIRLDLSHNKLEDTAAEAVAAALIDQPVLQACDIGSGGAGAIANALENNRVLRELDLKYNEADDDQKVMDRIKWLIDRNSNIGMTDL